jgi:hypothetical protein
MRLGETLGGISALLLVASSAAHAFLGWPAFEDALARQGVDGATRGALAVGWYFGSVAMLVFGVIVLSDTAMIWRGRPVDPKHLWAIAGGYIVFGLVAWLTRDLNPHFLLFLVTGLLVAGLALRAGRHPA